MNDIDADTELQTIRIVRLRAAIAFKKRQQKLDRLRATADGLEAQLVLLDTPVPTPVACTCNDQWAASPVR